MLARPSITSIAALLAAAVSSAAAETVKPGVPFRDNMVLQSGMPAPVWGTAEPGEKVVVEFAGQTECAEAGPDGAWRVVLDPLQVSAEPQELSISGIDPIRGVLVGEVWVCAGQSNMQWTFGKPHGVDDNDAEMAAANHPLIHCLRYRGKRYQDNQPWRVCSPDTIQEFPAVPYFFARRLTQELGIPVGIIGIADGGTSIEAWSPREALEKIPYGRKALAYADSQAYQDFLKGGEEREKIMRAWREANDPSLPKPTIEYPEEINAFGMAMPNNKPTDRYENLVTPLLGYAMRGVLWYQGENNLGGAERIDAYGPMLSNMATAWRAAWGQGEFPVLCVQLPNFGRVTSTGHEPDSTWAAIREQIAKAAATTPNMQCVVTIDTAGPADLHPRQKKPVGERLARMALREVYGKKDVVAKGPVFRSMRREGEALFLEFDDGGGLKWRDVKVGPFVIAGADRKFLPAKAEIVHGDVEGVLVSSPGVPEPVAVRYAWANNPELTLFNGAGLPAGPFRTDDWPLFPEQK